MKILYAGMKYDYGDRERGLSFEHCNFYDSLLRMGHDIVYFDFMSLMQAHGRSWMNHRLLDAARSEKPDLLLAVLFKDELDRSAVRRLSRSENFPTLNWFCDDHWRFEDFTRRWAPCFNWSVTTAQSALPKYKAIGYDRVIKSQWGCNHFLYRKLDLPMRHDVTFVGQPHGDRPETIQVIRDAGVRVETWGAGWESGRLSQEEMIEVFNASRINLNLSNASTLAVKPPKTIESSIPPGLAGAFDRVPGGKALKRGVKAVIRGARRMRQASQPAAEPATPAPPKYHEQIKGRNFEVPGCGGFLLSGMADNLDEYYEIGREIICYDDPADMLDKIRYFLDHEVERAGVALRGYRRTLREHTYVHRFNEIFRRIGLPGGTSEKPGETVEIGEERE
jgi:spore maturation protein CgeB